MRFAAVAVLGVALFCAVAPSFAQDQGEVTFWDSVRESKNPAELKAYLDAYPQGKFVPLARLRLSELAGATSAPAAAEPGKDAPAASQQPAGSKSALDWKQFSSAEGNFTVLLPGAPEVTKNDKDGLADRQYVMSLGAAVYIIDYHDFGPELVRINPSALLDKAQAGEMQAIHGTVRKSKSKTVLGYPGREVVFDGSKNNVALAGKVRIFLVNNRLYQILYLGPQGDETKPEVLAFLNSFHLIKEVGAHAPPEVSIPVGSEWREFRSEEGRFAALFPGVPETTSIKPDKDGITRHRFVVDQGQAAYLVTYAEYPRQIVAGDPKPVLDSAQDAALESMKGTLREHRVLSLAGNTGREIVFELPDHTTGVFRFFPVRDRLYQIIFVGPSGDAAKPEIERFLDSLTLVN
jgi:hypothetical protein